jgi:hypothetical protein
LWRRCDIDEWHLDCQAGGDLDLSRAVATPKNHDFIAAVTRREGGRLELLVPPSYTKVFDSNAALNDYLRALGLVELSISV